MKKFLLLLVAVMSVCAAHAAHTVYFDNTAAKYPTPYCYAWTTTDGTTTKNHYWPGIEMTHIYGNVYAYTTDDEYANCMFTDNSDSQTGEYNWTDGYLYSKAGNQGLFSFYVNVRYASNNFEDNGITADTEGFTTHSALPIGTGYFNIKTYNSVNGDLHYYTPGSIAQNEWVQLQLCEAKDHMTINNASKDQKFNVEYDVVNNKIRVTPVDDNGELSYTVLYLTGEFNSWDFEDAYRMTTTDGITYTSNAVTIESGKQFKIASSDWGAKWGVNDGVTASIGSISVNADGNNIKTSSKLDNVILSLNVETKVLTITQVITAGIEGVEAEAGEAEAEYFTVAGVRVDNPANPGLYLRRQGNKTSKVVIR